MNSNKLEALRALALHDGTPIEEARNAALAFVRGGGDAAKPKVVTIEDVRRLADVELVRRAFGPELEALKAEETKKRDDLKKEIQLHMQANDEMRVRLRAAEDQLADMKCSLKRLFDFANEKQKPTVRTFRVISDAKGIGK